MAVKTSAQQPEEAEGYWKGVAGASLAATEFGIITCMYTAQAGYSNGFAGALPGLCQAAAMFLIGLTGLLALVRHPALQNRQRRCLMVQRVAMNTHWWTGQQLLDQIALGMQAVIGFKAFAGVNIVCIVTHRGPRNLQARVGVFPGLLLGR